jgi:hypothetical protein
MGDLDAACLALRRAAERRAQVAMLCEDGTGIEAIDSGDGKSFGPVAG